MYLLSTIHGHGLIINNRGRNQMANGIGRKYSKYGGNDKQDQIIQPFDCTHKSMKWTMELLFKSGHVMHSY